MNKKEISRKIVESFLNTKFEECQIIVEYKEYNLTNGFYLKEKHYYLCNTKVLYLWERPDSFKVAFNNEFLRELEKWLPLRGKKHYFRDWLFNTKFPEFEYKNFLSEKFSYYS